MSIIVADTFKARVVGAAITTEKGLNVGGATTVAGAIIADGTVTASSFSGDGADLTGLNIPAGFTELDAALFN